MFDIGWDEMALIGVISLIVIGPKDLPVVMRQLGRWTRKARELAAEFHHGIDEMVREAELKEMKEQVAKATDTTRLRTEIAAALEAEPLAENRVLPPAEPANPGVPAEPAVPELPETAPFSPPNRPPEP